MGKGFLRKYRVLLLCFAVPMLLLAALYAVRHVYPFGSVSNLMWDLDIQYADFFSYYRSVLLGEADIAYSFSKSLGGSLTAFWGYYLSSPLNLLVALFRPGQIQLFVFVITALKLGLGGLTFGIFLRRRFQNLREMYVFFLAVGYVFTQYGVGQMSNIMWLDGVYMLPLMLLATDLFVDRGKVIPLYVTVALSIIFNWYTGYMNCIFVLVYFLYSYALSVREGPAKTAVGHILKFAAVEIAGVLGACFVFLPVALGQSGGRSAFDEGIFEFGTNGSALNILRGFMIGTRCPGGITMFCSIFALTAVGGYFLSKSIAKREKAISGIFLGVMAASMFFTPLEHIWVGFKFEGSYAFRFAYCAIAAFLIVAAAGLDKVHLLEKADRKKFLVGSIAVFLILDMVSSFEVRQLWVQITILVLYTVLFIGAYPPPPDLCFRADLGEKRLQLDWFWCSWVRSESMRFG